MDERRAAGGFEWLEARRTLAANWAGGMNGSWNVAANWNPAGIPTASTDVVIGSGMTVTIPPGVSDAAKTLTIDSGGTLSMPEGVNATNPTTNWVVNPDFESALPSQLWNWGSANYSISTSTQYAYTGSQSLELSGTSATAGEEQNSSYNANTASPGDSYTASVYAMTPNPLNGDVYLNLYFFDSSNNPIGSTIAPNSATILTSSSATGGPLTGSVGSDGWTHFYTTAVAPAGAAFVEVQVETYCSSPATVYFDDLELGPTPAGAQGPSSLIVGSSSNSSSYVAVSNSGTLTVGPANTVTIDGALAQTSTGTLDVQFRGAPSTGDFGLLNISGNATLAGTLEADVLSGYSPSTTDVFTPIEYASHSGAFATESMPSASGYQFNAAVTFTNVTIGAAPTTALTATVNASTNLHSANTNLLGVNMVYWDPDTGTSQTEQMLSSAGLDIYRFPGGSASDDYHFNQADNYYNGAKTFVQYVQAITADGGTGMVTLDYGSGSPEEAAAELAYLDGSPSDTTSLGTGIEWSDSVKAWQIVNWQTVGYWASLRGATPLATDDGLNFLRIDHPAAFTDIRYWEVGNEEYGSWEVDNHGTATPSGASTGAQHDPATYAAFAEQFARLAKEIQTTAGLPQITIGIDSDDPTGTDYNDWTTNVLKDGLAIGFVPGFISDHNYMQAPGDESDSFLLDDTVSDGASTFDWVTRYADYETLLVNTVGSQAASVQIMGTEYNSVYTNPGKQSTSLVNGLFIAESLGDLLGPPAAHRRRA